MITFHFEESELINMAPQSQIIEGQFECRTVAIGQFVHFLTPREVQIGDAID